jgi:adenylyl- and sulfurtransferase ThiI
MFCDLPIRSKMSALALASARPAAARLTVRRGADISIIFFVVAMAHSSAFAAMLRRSVTLH